MDGREPQGIIKIFRKEKGVNLEIDTLAYGDYVVVGEKYKFVIERKSVNDLVRSLNDGRIWKQLRGMSDYGEEYKKVLLIEGNKWRVIKSKRFSYSRWLGFLASMMTFGEIYLVFTSNYGETVDFICALDKRVSNGEKEIRLPTIKKGDRSLDDECIDILMAVSGVGSKKARKIIKEVRSLKRLANMKKKTLRALFGKVGEHIFDVFNHEYRGD